jgi:hypothetical protein
VELAPRADDRSVADRPDEQTIHTRFGRVFAVDTEVWDGSGQRHRLRRQWRYRQALLALTPMPPSSKIRRSISFDRAPAIVQF